MGLLRDHFKFYIDFPSGSSEVFPVNDSVQFDWEYHRELKVWRELLTTQLRFINTDEHKTFDALAALKEQIDTCYRIAIRVQVSYDKTLFTEKWKGILPLNEGEWDYSFCSALIKPRIDDIFTCILDTWKTELNLLKITETAKVETLPGMQECIEVEGFGIVPLTPTGVAWTLVRIEEIQNLSGSLFKWNYRFCRLRYEGTETDPVGYTLDPDGNYYAPVGVGPPVDTQEQAIDRISNPDGYYQISHTGNKLVTEFQISEIAIDNGVTLSNILTFLLPDCELTWCSDFFNINPLNDHPENGAYTYAENYLQELVFLQGSDIVRADNEDFDNATKFLTTFEKFWGDLNKLNLEMFYDRTNSCLRIEHISYFENIRMLDLTQPRFKNAIAGMSRYNQDKSEYPRTETFHFKYPTGEDDFDNASIAYDSNCSNDEVDNEKAYHMTYVINNISYLYNNKAIQDDVERMGNVTVMISTRNGVINSLLGPIANKTLLNGPMAWSNIIQALYLWERPLKFGSMNRGRAFEFLSTKKLKRQPKLGVKFTLEEYFDSFKPKDLVKTNLGWGSVKGATYTFPNALLELELLYE